MILTRSQMASWPIVQRLPLVSHLIPTSGSRSHLAVRFSYKGTEGNLIGIGPFLFMFRFHLDMTMCWLGFSSALLLSSVSFSLLVTRWLKPDTVTVSGLIGTGDCGDSYWSAAGETITEFCGTCVYPSPKSRNLQTIWNLAQNECLISQKLSRFTLIEIFMI